MKAPRFWYQSKSPQLAKILSPFSHIFTLAHNVRQKIVLPESLPVPVICCGNITVGGSGKTPISLAIAEHLKENGFTPHFLTRGYGRQKKRPTPKTLYLNPDRLPLNDFKLFGDEALLLGQSAPCWVDNNRKRSAELAYKAGADMLILDDGFQSPFLTKDLNLLLFNGEHAIGNGRILPAGPLREPLSQAVQRADYAIIVGEDRFNLSECIEKLGLPSMKVSFSPSKDVLRPFLSQPVCAFAGIAFPEDFFKMLRRYGVQLVKTYPFSDHHVYSKAEIQNLLEISKHLPLLTTAKDAVKFPEKIRDHFTIIDVKIAWQSIQKRDEIMNILFRKYQARLHP